jgi:PAS domain S-box-containing protein
MRAWLDTLLAPSGLTPHGFCLAWEPGLIWLYAISDSLIAISYYSIPIALLVVVRQRRDLAYPWVLWLFAAFIMACGTTHVFDALTLWVPAYWPAGIAKALTAILSMVTALLLWPLIPRILALPSQTTMQIANARLAESEARYRALFTQAPAAMYALDAAQRIAAVSDAWLDLFGYDRGEVIGTPIGAFQVRSVSDHPGEAPARDLERRFRCRSGRVLDVLLSTSTPAGHEGGLWRSICVVSDITARKRAETALYETETRLRQSEKLTALGQLAGGIAHDFNNILQMVQSGAALIHHRADDPVAVARLASMVEEAASRGTSVSRRLLAFARREELRAEPIELLMLLRGLQEVLRYTLGAAIVVRLDVPPSLPPVLADRGQLETVLVNLATNARDAMLDGGTMTMAARLAAAPANGRLAPGLYLRISVADTGAGMDAATLARAGEPFFTTKANGRGTGLGLSIARSFAEHSGGVMEIASTKGAGTTVDLWLPITPTAAATREPDTESMQATEPCRVLIVDDETLLREIVAEQLQQMGFEVHQAEDANAALAVLASSVRIDVLVTDLSMPGMDGIALIRIAQSNRPDLPAILLTGYAGSVEPATEGASFRLMRKPVTGPQLARMVHGAVPA